MSEPPREPDQREWSAIKALFDRVVDLPLVERAAILGEQPVAIREEVASLLVAADRVGGRFSEGAIPPTTPHELLPPRDWSGRRVGQYQIVREIGVGGMGTVYEAHRADDQFHKRVAIKMLNHGVHSLQALSRFRHERQILAQLEHRNIAALLDGGITDEGLPYFVMEYVEGEPIDRWCATRGLPVRGRLELFRQACGAVQYAHEHLVVHRDLKPGNILVSADGTVKLLDFGIAKLVDPTQSDELPVTQTGLTPMTMAYASPEQLRGEPVTTASDIFSLGIVCYELLTGRRPFGTPTPALALEAMERVPPAPSSMASDAVAHAMGIGTAHRLARTLEGDLDSIMLMALRPEAMRRYRSAAQFGEDILHHLRGEPVCARPDAFSYRATKFITRNAMAVAASTIAIVALIGGTAIAWNQALVAVRERDHAVLEGKRTAGVKQFFQNLIAAAKPKDGGKDVTVVEAIDLAIPAIDTSFGGDPQIRAAIKNTLGSTLHDMFLSERARPLLVDALRILEGIDKGRPSLERAEAMYNLAGVEEEIGDGVRAESLYRASLVMYGQVGTDSAEIYKGLNNLAGSLMQQGKLTEAVEVYSRVVRRTTALSPDDSTFYVVALGNLAMALTTLGRYAEAEPEFRRALAFHESRPAADSFRIASVLQPLAGALLFQGKFREAEATAQRAWDIDRSVLGPTNPGAIVALRMLVNVQADAGRCREALTNADLIIRLRGKELGETDASLGTAYLFAGWCRATLGDPVRGARDAREGLALRRKSFSATHWAVAQAESITGDVLAKGGAALASEAEQLLEAGYEGLRRELDPSHVRVKQGRDRLADFYRRHGRNAEADALGYSSPK